MDWCIRGGDGGSFCSQILDFVAEIASPLDRSREKLPFYASVGTRELLLVDREPWSLELYRFERAELKLVGRSTPDAADILTSVVFPFAWRLMRGDDRPLIHDS